MLFLCFRRDVLTLECVHFLGIEKFPVAYSHSSTQYYYVDLVLHSTTMLIYLYNCPTSCLSNGRCEIQTDQLALKSSSILNSCVGLHLSKFQHLVTKCA